MQSLNNIWLKIARTYDLLSSAAGFPHLVFTLNEEENLKSNEIAFGLFSSLDIQLLNSWDTVCAE